MSSTYARIDATPQLSRSIGERWLDKLWAAAWVSLAWFVAYWSRFFHFILNSTYNDANTHLIHLAFACMGVNTILTGYLLIYLPKFKGLTDSSAWPVYCPRIIPSMSCIGVITAFLLIRAIWPIYGFLAPLILAVEFTGFLFALHFVPWV